MRRIIVLVSVFATVSSPLFAADKTVPLPPEARQEVEEILRQAHAQEKVSSEAASTIREFNQLVEDLKANGLLPEAKGEELVAMAGTLDSTDRENIRAAAKSLKEASKVASGREPHLTTAKSEVEKALERLQTLLRQANALSVGDIIKTEIDKLVIDQENLMAKSTKMGLAMLNDEEVKQPDIDSLVKEQEEISKRVGALEEQFKEVAPDDEDGNLKKAKDILEQQGVKPRLDKAAQSAANKDLMDTVAEQKEALKALKDMAAQLKGDNKSPLEEARQQFEDIKKAQEALRKETEATPPAEFDKKAPDLQLKQADLNKRLEDALKALSAMKDSLEKKDGAMNKDGKQEKKNGEGKLTGPPPEMKAGTKAEESKMEGTSPSGSGKAGEHNAPQKTKPKDGGSDSTGKPGQAAEQPMQSALDDLGKKQQQAATEAQRQAEQALAQAMAQLQQQMMAQDFPGSTPQDVAQMMAQQEQIAKMQAEEAAKDPAKAAALAKAMAELAKAQADARAKGKPDGKPSDKPGKEPGQGKQDFVKTGVYGARPDEGKSEISSLDRHERDALGQNFAGELPREYRDMLKAYYERLSKN